MKAIVPMEFAKLPKREQKIIKDYMEEACNNHINEQYAELQIIWLKHCMTILFDAFGFKEDDLIAFMANWRRVYRQASRRAKDEANLAYLEQRMAEMFPTLGFPQNFIDELRDE